MDPIQEQVQIAERDRQVQRDQDLQIKAGSAAELIFHLHLQELILAAMIQLQQLVNEVCTMQLDMLIQRTAQLEPPLAVPPREQPRLAGKPAFVHPQTFSRLLFVTSFSHTLSEWGTMRPPPQACQPDNWTATWADAQAVHTASQARGGFRAPSGPAYKPPASALPQVRPWVDPSYQQKPTDLRKQPTAETLPLLRALPTDWSAPSDRPELGQAIAALQAPTTGDSAQPQQEPMYVSGSVVDASEAGTSETPSEQRERQAGEGILMSSPDTIQGTMDKDEDDDGYDNEEESDEDEDEEESEESQVAEVKSVKPSGASRKREGC